MSALTSRCSLSMLGGMRRPHKAAKIPSPAEESRRTNVLLEKLRSEFRTFGDGLSAIRDKLNSTFNQVGRNTETLGRVEDRLTAVESDVSVLKEDVAGLKSDVGVLKEDVAEIKTDVSALKKDVAEIKGPLQTFDQRLVSVESKVLP